MSQIKECAAKILNSKPLWHLDEQETYTHAEITAAYRLLNKMALRNLAQILNKQEVVS